MNERNLRAFGYDMFSEPVRRAAMEAARDSGQAAATGRVTLVQEGAQRPGRALGFLMYVPVYRAGAAARHAGTAPRRHHRLGVRAVPHERPDARPGRRARGDLEVDDLRRHQRAATAPCSTARPARARPAARQTFALQRRHRDRRPALAAGDPLRRRASKPRSASAHALAIAADRHRPGPAAGAGGVAAGQRTPPRAAAGRAA